MKKKLAILFSMLLCFCVGASMLYLGNSNTAQAEEAYKEYQGQYMTVFDESGNVKQVKVDTKNTAIKNAEKLSKEVDTGINTSSVLEKLGLIQTAHAETVDNAVVVFGSKKIYYTNVDTGAKDCYIHGAYQPDAAYLKTEGDYIYFKQAGVVGMVNAVQYAEDVKVYQFNDSLCVSYYSVSNGKLFHRITTNMTSTTPVRVGYGQSYMTEGTKYYSYDGHYFYTSYATMLNDYRNGTYTNSINSGNPYYNYYQYLPMRSKTVFTADQINSYINYRWQNSSYSTKNSVITGIGSALISAQDSYGANALLMAGIACNESAYGTSDIANNKNNLFGLNATDDNVGNADTFNSVDSCITDFASNWISKRYTNPKGYLIKSYVYHGAQVGDKQSGLNVSYASDAYWGEKAASIGYYIADYLNDKSDYQKYTVYLGSGSINTYADANTNTKLYDCEPYGASTLLNCPYIVLGTSGSYYKVQSDAVLQSDRSAVDSSSPAYDFNRDYGFVQTSKISAIGTSSASDDTVTLTSSTTSLSVNPTKVAYTGTSIKPSVSVVYKSTSLSQGTDYTVSYSSNSSVGTATVKVTGTGNYTGSVSSTFTITKKNVSDLSVSSIGTQTYSGSAKQPSVTIKNGSTTLGTSSYSLSYSSNTRPGVASVTITGKGSYTGTRTVNFNIKPKTNKLTSAKSTGKKKLYVKYSSSTGVSGYQIAYRKSTRSAWSYKTTSSKSKTITGLSRKKYYYVKVRSYKNSGSTRIYSNYSSTKKVKIK